jgi:hypothetical protein
MARSYRLLGLAMLLFAAGGLRAAQDGVQVNRGEPQIQRHSFDPRNKPAEMPALEKDEAAVTKSVFGIESAFNVEVLNHEERGGKTVGRFKVAGVNANLSLKVDIWNPNDAAKVIVEHEEGHRQISEYFYKDAQTVAERLGITSARCTAGRERMWMRPARRRWMGRCGNCRRDTWGRRRWSQRGRMRFLMRSRIMGGIRRSAWRRR